MNNYNSTEKEHIESVIHNCKRFYNDTLNETFFRDDNLKVAFMTLENGVEVYETFCGQFFPKYLRENYTAPGYMESFTAQAFVNKNVYGILIRLDTGVNPNAWYQIVLHEMSHIFCLVHEIGGEDFFEKYCVNKTENTMENGMICAGYAIWREFIADYIAVQINPFFRPISMLELKKEVSELDKEWSSTNPNAKVLVSHMLADILLNTKVRQQENPEAILQLLEKEKVFTSKVPGTSYAGMIRILYKQLRREECWKIDVDFVWELGEEYLNQMSLRYIATQINWE